MKKKTKPFKPTIAPTKKRAWSAFSLYIRTKYLVNEQVECYTCGRKYLIGKVSAGHGIPGRTNAVLFMEAVVRPQCFGCNIWGRGQYGVFTPKLMKELGSVEYERLFRLSQTTVHYTPYDYLEIEQKYLAKLWELAK
jgi:Bacteriophage Lambda NinG protein